MHNRFSFLLTFAASVALLVAGCDSAGSSSDDPPGDPGDSGGAASLTLARKANSDLPSEVDSAFVRLWQPDGSTNLVQRVEVPSSGDQTEVSFDAPSGDGYRAGVIATVGVTNNNELESPRAMGTSDPFSIASGDTSEVSLSLSVTGITVELPESISPGVTDTMKATVEMNAFGVEGSLRAEKGRTAEFRYFDGESLNEVGFGSEGDSTVTQEFEVSTSSSSRDTLYVKVQSSYKGITEWTEDTGNSLWYAYFPVPSPDNLPSHDEGPSFKIPVESGGDSSGTVIITFSRDGNGWSKTRRVVE